MLKPESEEALCDAIRSAESPLRICGGRTRGGGDGAGVPLSAAEFSGITLYEPGALTLVARAGTPVEEIDAALAAEHQQLAFEPPDLRAVLGTEGASTIGGVVATNASGPRRIQAGACRDSLIGLRFVDGAGKVIKNGGRVMKNVTGYDLVKLLCGSHGTLGVLSEVSFKLLPRNDAEATLVVPAPDIAAAVALMSRALGSPFGVSGAAFDPAQAQAYLRLEGFEASVAYRIGQLQKLLNAGDPITDIAQSQAIWAKIRDAHAVIGSGDLWRISVKPSDAPKLPLDGQLLYDWGGGLIWARVAPGTDIRHLMRDVAGHATCLIGAFPRFHPEPPAVAALSSGLRQHFDPRGLLNPDLMEVPA